MSASQCVRMCLWLSDHLDSVGLLSLLACPFCVPPPSPQQSLGPQELGEWTMLKQIKMAGTITATKMKSLEEGGPLLNVLPSKDEMSIYLME